MDGSIFPDKRVFAMLGFALLTPTYGPKMRRKRILFLLGLRDARSVKIAVNLVMCAAIMLSNGCVVVESHGEGTENTTRVAAEFREGDHVVDSYLLKWKRGEHRAAVPAQKAKWVAVAGLLYEYRIGPMDEYRSYTLDGLSSGDPEVVETSVIALIPMRGQDVVDALLKEVVSPSASSSVRELAIDSLQKKWRRPESTSEALDEREYLATKLREICRGTGRVRAQELCSSPPGI